MAHPTPDAPANLCELSQGEHMLLWAFRAHAFGVGGCGLVRRQFDQACGLAGAEALNGLAVFVRELALHGRRRVSLGVPGSYRLSRDEQLILALFAAAQGRDYPRLEAHLVWLVGGEPHALFGAAAALVAEAFEMNGLLLRMPELEAAPAADPAPDAPASDIVVPLRPRAAAS